MSRYEMPKNHKIHGVEVQKGLIDAGQKTMKTKTHREKVSEEVEKMDARRDGQMLKMHKPKE